MKRKKAKPSKVFVAPVITERQLLDALMQHWTGTNDDSGGRTALELAQASKLHVDTVRKQLRALLECGKARVGFEARRGIDTLNRKVPVYFLVK